MELPVSWAQMVNASGVGLKLWWSWLTAYEAWPTRAFLTLTNSRQACLTLLQKNEKLYDPGSSPQCYYLSCLGVSTINIIEKKYIYPKAIQYSPLYSCIFACRDTYHCKLNFLPRCHFKYHIVCKTDTTDQLIDRPRHLLLGHNSVIPKKVQFLSR